MELHYFPSKVSLYIRMLPQEITEMSHNESLTTFFCIGCQIVRSNRNLFIKNDYVNISTHFVSIQNLVKRITLILTPNVNSHDILICIATGENLYISYCSKICSFAAIWIWVWMGKYAKGFLEKRSGSEVLDWVLDRQFWKKSMNSEDKQH